MRYYIINSQGKEVVFDVSGSQNIDADTLSFNITDGEKNSSQYFVKAVAGKNYISKDTVNWSHLPKMSAGKTVVNVDENLDVYRGFKPSGLSNASAGTLKTDMPGKVVKVMTAEGAVVNQGDTLLILEAMKMENEIKAGIDGVVKSVNVEEGQTLDSGHVMIEIEE